MWGYTHPQFAQKILFHKAFANGRRIAIIIALLESTHTPSQLCALLHISAPAMTRHVAVLRRAGVVYGIRKGNAVCLYLRDPEMVRKMPEIRI